MRSRGCSRLLARVEAARGQRRSLGEGGRARASRRLRAALGAMPPLPSKQDYDEVVRRLKAAQAALTPKLQELREIEGWQRWANVGIQEQLCEKMEALKAADGTRRRSRAGSASCSSSGVRRPTCRARRARRSGGDSRRRTTRSGRAARRTSRRRPNARQENLQKKIALCERAEGARRVDAAGFRPPKRSRRCRRIGKRSVRSRAARKRRSGSGSAPPAIDSSPGATRISRSARARGPRTSRRRTRCARAPRRSPNRPIGTARRPRSGVCRPSGRRSAR